MGKVIFITSFDTMATLINYDDKTFDIKENIKQNKKCLSFMHFIKWSITTLRLKKHGQQWPQ